VADIALLGVQNLIAPWSRRTAGAR